MNITQDFINAHMVVIDEINKKMLFAESRGLILHKIFSIYGQQKDFHCLQIGRLYAHQNSEVL
jgi:DNA replication protein DnaC